MLNLLLALALTSSISGNDIDIPTPLNTQVETTVDDSTNADIVSAINETNELLETILASQTVISDKLVSQERQLDNITFVVIVLLLLPIIKGITNKLTHRKENS